MTGDLWGHLPGAAGPDYGVVNSGIVTADSGEVPVIANRVDGGAGNIYSRFIPGRTYKIILDTRRLTVKITTVK